MPGSDTRPIAVLFLGDSFTEGFGLMPEQSFPARIQQKLEEINSSVKVMNGGISGDTVMDAYYRLSPLLRAHPDVEVLVVFLGANDLFNGISPEFSEGHFIKIIDHARQANPDIRIMISVLPVIPGLESNGREFEKIFPRLEQEYGVELLPFFLEGVMLEPELCLPDGVHPNAQGMNLVAGTVWQSVFIDRLL